jgi:hypothetical protein
MNHSHRHVICPLVLFVGAFGFSATVLAQETTTTSSQPKSVTRVVTVDTAQVVYVSGDDVVIKNADGRLLLLALPSSTAMRVDGKPAALKDLTPGTTLAHVQARTLLESEVTSVTQIDGTIMQVTPPRWVTLRLGDGTIKRYEIPKETTFQVEGKTATAFELRKGMKISATAVTTQGVNTESAKAAVVGQTPPLIGALLIFRGR